MASAEGTELTPVSIKTQGLLAAGNTDKSSQDDLLLLSTWHKVVYGEGDGTPLQYSCLENPMDGGAWWGAVHGVAKIWTRLSDFPFTFHFHSLEKEMATHSSVLAWRIPGTGEPGESQGRGSLAGCHLWGHTESDTTEVT